ncbi:MAG: LPXTG cell wall anchor domain-containing protein, partial [Lachnospiraceae bacterium]|nr:LPXTG cell wall anchor domain-containing protein [Lachnospiraceae bacterium]
ACGRRVRRLAGGGGGGARASETPDDPTPTPGTGTEDTPKTGDTMSWVLLAALAVVTLGGVIVSKKARA